MDFSYQTKNMEEMERQHVNENMHSSTSTPHPPTYISATYSEQEFSPESKLKSNTSSPKRTEKQNNHQASRLGGNL